MTDDVLKDPPKSTSEAVRKSMQGNKRANTSPELLVRGMLRELGYRGYRLQWKKCPGRPDVAFPGRRIAIYVNGCFWHRCPKCNLPVPKSNVQYWMTKFETNKARDEKNEAAALADGWRIITIWECELKKKNLQRTKLMLRRKMAMLNNADFTDPAIRRIALQRSAMVHGSRKRG